MKFSKITLTVVPAAKQTTNLVYGPHSNTLLFLWQQLIHTGLHGECPT